LAVLRFQYRARKVSYRGRIVFETAASDRTQSTESYSAIRNSTESARAARRRISPVGESLTAKCLPRRDNATDLPLQNFEIFTRDEKDITVRN